MKSGSMVSKSFRTSTGPIRLVYIRLLQQELESMEQAYTRIVQISQRILSGLFPAFHLYQLIGAASTTTSMVCGKSTLQYRLINAASTTRNLVCGKCTLQMLYYRIVMSPFSGSCKMDMNNASVQERI